METIKNLLIRARHAGVLLLVGFILIVYVSFGVLYWQQGLQQKNLTEQVNKLSLIVSRPLPGVEALRVEYDKVNATLAPISASEAIAILVGIAEESGINVEVSTGKFRVSSAAFSQSGVGEGTYRLLSFRNIYVQGDDDAVMAFVSNLDSGKTLPNMVLKKLITGEAEVVKPGDDARRAEFSRVASAVREMMKDNGLSEIPNPLSFAGGIAFNRMDFGFPDIMTTAAEKGYTGEDLPKDGYVLYAHDKISTDNTTLFTTVNYIDITTTVYYYTSEFDGTVRQFDGTDVTVATEHRDEAEYNTEMVVTLDVDIYTKLE